MISVYYYIITNENIGWIFSLENVITNNKVLVSLDMRLSVQNYCNV